jgi:hypothetical protein
MMDEFSLINTNKSGNHDELASSSQKTAAAEEENYCMKRK